MQQNKRYVLLVINQDIYLKIAPTENSANFVKKTNHEEKDCFSKNNRKPAAKVNKEQCRICKKFNHKEKDCYFRNKEKQPPIAFIAEQREEYDKRSSVTFIVDSGSTCHMINEEKLLDHQKKCDVNINVAKKEEVMRAKTSGQFKGRQCNLNEVIFVPELSKNLLLVSSIVNNGGEVNFKGDKVTILKDGKKVLKGDQLDNGLYAVNIEQHFSKQNDSNLTLPSENKTQEWHRKLGHIRMQNLRKLESLVDGMELNKLENQENDVCEICIMAKQTRKSFGNERSRATRPLEIVHTDLCGPIEPLTHDNKKYIMTFLDDYTHFCYVYLLSNKYEAKEYIKEYVNEVERFLNVKVSKLRCDNGGEYANTQVKEWCKMKGIILDFTIPYTPQLNGKAERLNRTLIKKTRALLLDSKLNKEMWGEATRVAAYLINRSPSNTVQTTPAQMWFGRKSNLSNVKLFGSEVYVKKLGNLKKLDSKSEKYLLIGYSGNGYRLWDMQKRRIIIARDVVFTGKLTNEMTSVIQPRYREDLDSEIEESQDTKLELDTHDKPQNSTNSRYMLRNRENINRPERLKDYEVLNSVSEEIGLLTYNEAVTGVDKENWIKAIQEEKDSLKKNETWDFVKAECVKELIYIKALIEELTNETILAKLNIDNQSAMTLMKTGQMNRKTKHIDVRYHFLKDQIRENVDVQFCPTQDQVADILTKPLPKETFEKHRSSLLQIMLEISRKEIRLLEPQNDQTLNRVQNKPKKHYNANNFNKSRFTNQGTPSFSGASKPKCYRCGLDTHSAQECGAKKMTCTYCNKLGHLFRACRNRPNQNNNRNHKNFNQTKVKTIQEENKTEVGESSDEYTYYTGAENKEKVQIDGSEINMIIDTGSDRTFISYNKMLELYGHKIMPKLHDTTRTFFAYGQDRPLPCYGYFNAVISWKENSVSEEIFVIDKKVESLLGGKASFELGIIKRVNHVNESMSANIETLVQEHEHLFHGLGTIKGYSHKVTLKDNYRPIAQRCRRIPYAMVEAVNQELDKMLENGIIEEVHQGSEWVSNIIVVPKRDSEEIRLCIDLREVNKAILRERHPIPTIDNMLHALKGAKVFAKLDAKKGFWQVDLDPQSRPLTTFITHRGCYRFCKVPFGLSSAPEAYQKGMDSILLDLKGVICYLDEVIVYAKDRQELEERLRKVLQRFDKVGIRLNRNKCKFAMEELDILGHIVSSEGIKPDNRKIEAVLNFPIPKNIEMLRSFLGTCGFLRKFIPNFSKLAEPLNNLTRKNVRWNWDLKTNKAFQDLKESLTKEPCLAYYNLNSPTELITDASPIGLGAVLIQTQQNGIKRPIAYASRSLTDTEKRYSQIEKKTLGCVWAIEHFNTYIWGRKFVLKTDHKPLIYMLNPKNGAVLPPRIQRLSWRLQPYDFEIEFIQGKQNIADIFSRQPLSNTSDEKWLEDYVHKVLSITSEALSLKEIKVCTEQDPLFQKLKDMVQKGVWPYPLNEEFKCFYKFKDELSIFDNLILKDSRILLPSKLIKRVLRIAHETHQGMTRTKQLLREKYFWINMDFDIENLIRNCPICVRNQPLINDQPLQIVPLPSKPWMKLGIDIVGPIGHHYVLTVIDYYSSYPEAMIIEDISSKTIIKKLMEIFARHGYPHEVVTDNGLQFVSTSMERFLKECGIRHIKASPHYPKSNGKIERFHRFLKKQFNSSSEEGKDWKEDLSRILMSYRTTPNRSTGKTPAFLLFSREIKTKLSSLVNDAEEDESNIKEFNMVYKEKMKTYNDIIRKASPHNFEIGNLVYVANPNNGKLDSNFRSEHHVILENTSINSFKLVNTKNGKIIHRNAKHLKHVPTQETNQGISDLIPEESQENLSSDSTRIEHLNSSDVQIPDDNSSNQDKDTSLNRPSSSRTGSTFNPVVSDRLDAETLHQLPPEIQPPETFDFSTPNEWPKWRKRFKRYLVVSGMKKKEEADKIDLFMYLMGDRADDIFRTFKFEKEEEATKIDSVLKAFDSHFCVRKNIIYERAKFNSRIQEDREPVDEFITSLYKLADSCEFEGLHEQLIRDRIVVGVRDKALSERMQLDSELTLEKAVKMVRQQEAVRQQQVDLQRPSASQKVNQVKFNSKKQSPKQQQQPSRKKEKSAKTRSRCPKCGGFNHREGQACRAEGQKCNLCSKTGHFANCCPDKQAKTAEVKAVSELDEEIGFLLEVSAVEDSSNLDDDEGECRRRWTAEIQVNGKQVKFKLDSQADVTCVPLCLFKKIMGQQRLVKSDINLRAAEFSELQTVGMFISTLRNGNYEIKEKIYVIRRLSEPLLSRRACELLNLARRIEVVATRINPIKEFPEVFEGLGQIGNPYEIKLKPGAKPYAVHTPRRVPITFDGKAQNKIGRAREGGNHSTSMDGVMCYLDDILIFASDSKTHDRILRLVLRKLKEAKVTLNKAKCVFGVPRINFLGHILDEDGIRPDPAKIEAVAKMPAPTDVHGVRRFLGMVNHLGRFVENVSEIVAPLNQLLVKGQDFVWDCSQERAFRKLKELLMTQPILAAYDVRKPTMVSSDASSYGLGAVLKQEGKNGIWRPVAYSSRTMTLTEKRYAQIEKEALAITWACERFQDFLLGKRFRIETDHKPLIPLFSTKELSSLTPRLQRFRMRMMRFGFEIVHIPGKELLDADALSRQPLLTTEGGENERQTSAHINAVLSSITDKDEMLTKIFEAQQEDTTLKAVVNYLEQGWPDKKKMSQALLSYWHVKDELGVQNGLLMRSCRLVVPASMKLEILDKLHAGHFGITKTRLRARETVWWPGISEEIAETVRKCSVCIQEAVSKHEPLIPTKFPTRPWQKIGMDLFKFENKWYLVVIDYYSRFPEVVQLDRLTASVVVRSCKSIFARHGIPETVVSDNGTQFGAAREFANFARQYGFQHVTSSPRFPQSNGMAEAEVKSPHGKFSSKCCVLSREPQCSVCDASDPNKRHPITNAIDGTNRWWQSPSLQNGKHFQWVTITLDLRQLIGLCWRMAAVPGVPSGLRDREVGHLTSARQLDPGAVRGRHQLPAVAVLRRHGLRLLGGLRHTSHAGRQTSPLPHGRRGHLHGALLQAQPTGGGRG
ncbi:K02A2.6-like, partial [Cordylochernes scorpioides]